MCHRFFQIAFIARCVSVRLDLFSVFTFVMAYDHVTVGEKHSANQLRSLIPFLTFSRCTKQCVRTDFWKANTFLCSLLDKMLLSVEITVGNFTSSYSSWPLEAIEIA